MAGSFRKALRALSFRMGQRLLGRELSHLDFDQLLDRGVITVGPHFMFGRPTIRHSRAVPSGVRVGAFCGIADDVLFIVGREHHTEWITTYPIRNYLMGRNDRSDGPFDKGDIRVGSDVWIGYRAIILSGVSIGNGVVIGAGSVVTKDVPSYTIVGGNPAREIRRRFTEKQIEALESIAWWDWPDEKIFEHSDMLCSPDIDAFIARFSDSERDADRRLLES